MQDKVRWKLIQINNINPGEIKNKIEYKVPGNRLLTGILFSPPAYDSISLSGGDMLGRLCLHINNKQSNPLQYLVSPDYSWRIRKYAPVKFEEPLKGGTLIQGFYRDAGYSVQYPYTLKLFLRTIPV